MTLPITITTKQTGDLHQKWKKVNTTQRTLMIVSAVLWGLLTIGHIISGIMNPDFVLHWVNAGLTLSIVVLNIISVYFPLLFVPSMTTTVTFNDGDARISMDKKGRMESYSANWDKVHIHESSDCYFFQVNWHQMQIFRKEDLTDCTADELSAFLQEKIGKRYVELKSANRKAFP